MSRSMPNEKMSNPATKFLQWDSDNKCFKYYDKEAKTNVQVKLPFQFLVLDQLHTIKGYSDIDKAGIYANEVRNLKTDVLKIKIGKTDAAQGLYEDVKNKVSGARYASSVYAAIFDDNKELVIVNIAFTGSSLSAWIEFGKNHKVTEGAIKVATTKYVEKNKKVNWNEPVFEAIKIKPETDAKAVELDKVLQQYLKQYATASKMEPDNTIAPVQETVQEEVKTNASVADFDDLPF